ncbi:MAG TPA: hypothetical protein VIO94_09225 [Phenylobacterium sp.]
MIIRLCLAVALVVTASPAAAAGLNEQTVRRFLAAQEAAWNARRLDVYFAGFTPDATFVDQHVTPKETITYGRSTVSQAKAAAKRFLAGAKSNERSTIRSIWISKDRSKGRVLGWEVTTVVTGGRTRRVCANTEQVLIYTGSKILSRGQTDSIVNCPAGLR